MVSVRDPLAWRLTKVNGGVQVHVRMSATLFRISGTAGWIALQLGVWLEDHYIAMRFTQNGGYPHERTCNTTRIEIHIFAPARASPKLCLTGE